MLWLNLQTNIIRSPEYVGAEPNQRATWLNVLIYCVEQENGGLIKNCESWKDRQWQQTCGVTIFEINNSEPLLYWIDLDLCVWNYPLYTEEVIKQRRESGRKGGLSKSEAKTQAAKDNGTKHNPSTTEANAKQNPSNNPTKGKEREGKEKEGNEVSASSKPKTAPAIDIVWLNNLPNDPAFQGIDVNRELAKAKLWAETKKRKYSKRFILNWLMRVEAPIKQTSVIVKKQLIAPMGWKDILNKEFPDSIYSMGGTNEAKTWEDLSKDAQEAIIETIRL